MLISDGEDSAKCFEIMLSGVFLYLAGIKVISWDFLGYFQYALRLNLEFYNFNIDAVAESSNQDL
jgi:hypothetical protein